MPDLLHEDDHQVSRTHLSMIQNMLCSDKLKQNQAWDRVYKKYITLVRAAVLSMTYKMCEADVQDVMQDTMIRIWRAMNSQQFAYDPQRGYFRHYLRKIIRQCCIDAIRSRFPSAMLAPTNTQQQNDPNDPQNNPINQVPDDTALAKYKILEARLCFELTFAEFIKKHTELHSQDFDILGLLFGYDRQADQWLEDIPKPIDIYEQLNIDPKIVYALSNKYKKELWAMINEEEP